MALTPETIRSCGFRADKDARQSAETWQTHFARAIEAAATAPLLEQIAQLEQQLAEARKDAERLRFALGDPDGKLTASQLTRCAHEVRQKADRWDDWHEAQNEIETAMPQGWRLVLDCSPGDWSFDLLDPDGNRVDFDNDCDSTAQMMRSAIACAREKAGVLSNTTDEPRPGVGSI